MWNKIFAIKSGTSEVSVYLNGEGTTVEVELTKATSHQQEVAFCRYVTKCVRKANMVSYAGVSKYVMVRIMTHRDERRLQHLLQMLDSKRTRKVLCASGGRGGEFHVR